jgi:hypothetical protein
MQRYVVQQEHEDLWTVSHRDQTLYEYTSEEEARSAALALAKNAAELGIQATVMVLPPGTEVTVEREPRRRYSGM